MESWVKEKEAKNFRSVFLYLHALIHSVISLVLIYSENHFFRIVVWIFFSHLLIDGLKAMFQKENTKRTLFLMDQLIHLVILFLITYSYSEFPFDLNLPLPADRTLWLFMVSVIFLTLPSSILIKTVISKWTPYVDTLHNNNPNDDSLQQAGMFIGILERLFVFCFILYGQWEAVGFLITTKSVFRFGDLKNGVERKLTEYVLIGTLISFGLAILVGIVFLQLNSY